MITVIHKEGNTYKIKSFLDVVCNYFILNTPNIELVESYKQKTDSHLLSDDDELLTIYIITYSGDIEQAIKEFTVKIKNMLALSKYEDITS